MGGSVLVLLVVLAGSRWEVSAGCVSSPLTACAGSWELGGVENKQTCDSLCGFLVALVVKNLPANAGDMRNTGSIPESGRSPGGGHGNPLWCSCPENPRDKGAWWATVHGVVKSRTQLKQSNLACMHACVTSGTFCSILEPPPWAPAY